MSIYSNVTEQDLINSRKPAEQQKNQRALKIKNRISKQTDDVILAVCLSPITKKLDEVNKSTQEVGEIIKKSQPSQNVKTILQNSESETPAIRNTNISRSLLDTLTHMKGNKNFFKLVEDDGEVFWNTIPIKALGENMISIKDQEYDKKPIIPKYFTNTDLTTKNMSDGDRSIVYDVLKNTGFFSMKHTKGLKSARMRDALYDLPKSIDKIQNPPLPAIENVEDSSDLEGRGVKTIIPSNVIDIYTRLKVLLGLKLSGHTDTLTEASNLIDELYKGGEIQNKQQYGKTRNKFSKIKIITKIIVFKPECTYEYESTSIILINYLYKCNYTILSII